MVWRNGSEIENAIDEVLKADILVIIGTSMQVYPAASLKDYAKTNVPIIYIDPSDTYTNSSITHIKKMQQKVSKN